jgi:hypothetical protein
MGDATTVLEPLDDAIDHVRGGAAGHVILEYRFWEMHSLLFRQRSALASDDVRRYPAELGLDLARLDRDRAGD